ncbi:AEC family transporter [Klebsiella pneumoniae]|uniref:AEC family transporter n=1 Tax=Klebsiella pneumoniae TaxID=573 RepID=UPI003EB9E5ED
MTYVIIHALAPIFVIMLLGFWAGKAGMVDNKNVSLLNIFVMDFALPATLFSATVQTPWAGIVAQSPLVLVLTGAMWITYAAIYFLATSVFKRTPQDAAVLTLTVALPNYAALGLPILGSVLGEGASTSLSVAVSIACGSVLMTPFCLLILEREKARQPFIAWGLVMLLGLHGSIAITAILMIALAAGFFGVVFGNRFGVQSPDAEAVLLLSSVLCILSLPLFISLTSGL